MINKLKIFLKNKIIKNSEDKNKLLKAKTEIEAWLKKYDVLNYELIEDEEYGYVVNINGNVNLFNKKLISINIKFNQINGWFDCSGNKLKSLMGCPELVDGYFNCSNNQLKSLQYSPEIVKGNFDCDINELKSLIGASKSIDGNFYCSRNEIESLEGCPQFINGKLWCNNNKLNIEGIKNLSNIDIKGNFINLEFNIELGELKNIKDFNELKKILTIYKEKENLMNVVEVTDKSVEKLNIFLNKESTDISIKIKKINKI